jgi:hypothetical protein
MSGSQSTATRSGPATTRPATAGTLTHGRQLALDQSGNVVMAHSSTL